MEYWFSIIATIMASVLLLLDKFSDFYKGQVEKVRNLKIILFVFYIVIILSALIIAIYEIISLASEVKKYEVYASPPEINLKHNSYKEFLLTVTNNKKHSIFDVNLSICANDNNVDIFDIIDITPIKRDTLPNIFGSLYGATLSNGCVSVCFRDLGPYSSRVFKVRANSENIDDNLGIMFFIHDWSLQPSQHSAVTFEKGWLENANNYFKDDSTQSEKTGEVSFQAIKFPANPYFPDQIEFNLVELITNR